MEKLWPVRFIKAKLIWAIAACIKTNRQTDTTIDHKFRLNHSLIIQPDWHRKKEKEKEKEKKKKKRIINLQRHYLFLDPSLSFHSLKSCHVESIAREIQQQGLLQPQTIAI